MKLEMSEFLKLASEEQLQTRGRRRYRKGKKGRSRVAIPKSD